MKITPLAITLLSAITTAGIQDLDSDVYRLTFDYHHLRLRGEVTSRERIAATYSRNHEKKTATWSDVTVAAAKGTGPFDPGVGRAFMDGFTHPLGSGAELMTNEFFSRIPPTAMQERSLIWDARMFELFGEETFDQLAPNEPHRFSGTSEISLAGAGTFSLRAAQLTLIGRTTRRGAECAVIDYQAFFNPLRLELSGLTLTGRSHFWGTIWIALGDKRIEYGTLYEDVLGEVSVGTAAPQPTNVFRSGTIERAPRR